MANQYNIKQIFDVKISDDDAGFIDKMLKKSQIEQYEKAQRRVSRPMYALSASLAAFMLVAGGVGLWLNYNAGDFGTLSHSTDAITTITPRVTTPAETTTAPATTASPTTTEVTTTTGGSPTAPTTTTTEATTAPETTTAPVTTTEVVTTEEIIPVYDTISVALQDRIIQDYHDFYFEGFAFAQVNLLGYLGTYNGYFVLIISDEYNSTGNPMKIWKNGEFFRPMTVADDLFTDEDIAALNERSSISSRSGQNGLAPR